MTELLALVSEVSVILFLVSSMGEIGLGLQLRDIVAPLRNLRLVVAALLANFIIVPLLAFGIARLLHLEPPFATGLLLLGLGAGAPFMPKIAGMAKGDVALAVGLLVMLMLGTIILMPIALPLLIEGTQVNPLKIVRLLVLMILLPLTIGMVIKARRGELAGSLIPVLERISLATLSTTVVLIVSLNFQSLLAVFGRNAILAGLLFSVLSALTGWLLGGKVPARRTVMSLGTGFRCFPAALIVSVQNFTDPNVTIMVIVTTLTALISLLPVSWWMAKHASMTRPGC